MPTILPISTMQQFYLTQAADAQREAGGATLVNVRDRFLASAATWTGLAARTRRVDLMHAGILAAKAAERSALVSAPIAAAGPSSGASHG